MTGEHAQATTTGLVRSPALALARRPLEVLELDQVTRRREQLGALLVETVLGRQLLSKLSALELEGHRMRGTGLDPLEISKAQIADPFRPKSGEEGGLSSRGEQAKHSGNRRLGHAEIACDGRREGLRR